MSPSDVHHLAAAYALDALTHVEREAFEAHRPTCDICFQEIQEFRETAAVLAEGVGVTPPPGLKGRVMTEVSKTRQLPPIVPDQVTVRRETRNRRFQRYALLTSAAAVLLALAGTVAVLWPGSDDGGGDLLAEPDAVVSSLEGVDGNLVVVWSPGRAELAVVGGGVDDPGPGFTYELWFLLDGGAVAPAGLFEPDETGTVRTVLSVDRADGTGFGVTIEPDGGSPQPTTDVLYVGST